MKICRRCYAYAIRTKWERKADRIDALIKVLGCTEDDLVSRLKEINGTKVEWKVCERCMKNDGQYFEGILQLRGEQIEEIKHFIYNGLPEDESVFIQKENDVKGGIDFYFTNKRYLAQLGKLLLSQFGGELKESHKIVTRDKQSSKDLYRLYLLFRPFDFTKGDVVTTDEAIMQIAFINKNIITGNDLAFAKKRKIRSTEITQIILKKHFKKVDVVRRKPVLEVLDPETFQPTLVENNPVIKKDKVKVVKHEEKLYCVE